MSIAPQRGRPAPLLFTVRQRVVWPRLSAAELRNAPLGTRARRERRRRRIRLAMGISLATVVAGMVAWLMWPGLR